MSVPYDPKVRMDYAWRISLVVTLVMPKAYTYLQWESEVEPQKRSCLRLTEHHVDRYGLKIDYT